MPSPFPGMDPYLEGEDWVSFHGALAMEIVRQLSPKLRPRYTVRPNKRYVLDSEDEFMIEIASAHPDVAVYRSRGAGRSTGGSAVLEAPLSIKTVMPVRVPQVSVEIRDVAERLLVTAMEILSPTNKRGRGREDYLKKREGILLSSTHLIEIDLLRGGERVPMEDSLPPDPYFIFISRFSRRPVTDVWPIKLTDRLPVVPVPLRRDDPDADLDLQSAYDLAYDTLGFDMEIEYQHPPRKRLSAEEEQWAIEHLTQQGYSPHW